MMNNDLRNLSDSELSIRVIEQQDKSSMNILYRRYQHIVLGALMYYLEDINLAQYGTKIVFEDLWDNSPNFVPPYHFKTLLQQQIYKYIYETAKSKDKRLKEDFSVENIEWIFLLRSSLKSKNISKILNNCLDVLSKREYDLLITFYKEEKNIKYLAKQFNSNYFDILEEIQQAKRKIQICLHQKTTVGQNG
ncbi:MAG TPA: hypothetical protein VK027_08315 [Chitinophagaceae bacterium]|nr:hypothetical protein [Chitinophagaceae bacterium]